MAKGTTCGAANRRCKMTERCFVLGIKPVCNTFGQMAPTLIYPVHNASANATRNCALQNRQWIDLSCRTILICSCSYARAQSAGGKVNRCFLCLVNEPRPKGILADLTYSALELLCQYVGFNSVFRIFRGYRL